MTQGLKQELPADSNNIKLQVDLEDNYVKGFPMPVAITIAVAQQDTTINFLAQPTPFNTQGSIGVTLVDSLGAIVVDEIPQSSIDFDDEQGLLSLSSGERRRYLIDISDMVPGTLNPGSYVMTLSYVHPMFVSRAEGLKLVIRDPDKTESQWLAKHHKEIEEAGSWAKWATESSVKPESLEPPVNAPMLVRFHAAFRYLVYTPTPLADVDPQFLSSLKGVTRPEALLMEMEVYQAAKQYGPATRVAEEARSIAPAVEWLIEAAYNGAGLIAGIRFEP